ATFNVSGVEWGIRRACEFAPERRTESAPDRVLETALRARTMRGKSSAGLQPAPGGVPARAEAPRHFSSPDGESPKAPAAARSAEPPSPPADHRHMATDDLPVLYVKPGCPWCHEVEEFLSQNGVNYR